MIRLLAKHANEDLVCFDRARTRAQLAGLVQRATAALDELREGMGDTEASELVLACSDRYLATAALIAAWSRGWVVAFPTNTRPEVVRRLADRPGCVCVVHDQAGEPGLDLSVLDASPELIGEAKLEASALRFDPERVAVCVYTSGSTGESTPHPKTFAQLFEEVGALVELFDLDRARVLCASPVQHVYGLLFGVLVPLCTGGALSARSPLLPHDVVDEIEEHAVDVLVSVPAHLRALSSRGGEALCAPPSLQRVFSSAAPLPDEDARRLADAGWKVAQVLGSTESGGIAWREEAGAAWRPLPGVRFDISEDGVLLLDSPWLEPVGPGASRPYRTQDRAERCPGGFLHLGRADRVTKVAGRRVDLGAMEHFIRGLEGVSDVAVVARAVAGLRGVELLCVVESAPTAASLEQVAEALAREFDAVVVPRRLRLCASLPRNARGKLDRLAIEEFFASARPALKLQALCEPLEWNTVVVPDLVYLKGHFEGAPILPGIVQLQRLALKQTRASWPELIGLRRVKRVKFRALVRPGDKLKLKLARPKRAEVRWTITREDTPVSQGVFEFTVEEKN